MWLGDTSLVPKHTLRSLLICISNAMKIHTAADGGGGRGLLGGPNRSHHFVCKMEIFTLAVPPQKPSTGPRGETTSGTLWNLGRTVYLAHDHQTVNPDPASSHPAGGRHTTGPDVCDATGIVAPWLSSPAYIGSTCRAGRAVCHSLLGS